MKLHRERPHVYVRVLACPPHLQQVALVLLHDAVPVQGGEHGVDDPLRVLLVQPLPGHQAGGHQPGVLPHPAQELPVDALLEAQGLVAVHKLGVLQHLGVLAAFGGRSLGAAGQGAGLITLT